MLKLGEDKKFIDAIGNASRLRILLALWKSGELRIYKICRITGLGRSSVRRHLDNLVDNGIVSKRIYGEIILYSINQDNPMVDALVGFFKRARL